MLRIPPPLILDIPSFPALSSRGVCYLDTERILGNVDTSCCRKQIAVVFAASCHLYILTEESYRSHLSRLTIFLCSRSEKAQTRGRTVCVCVGRGVDDSSFDPGVLVVKSCLD